MGNRYTCPNCERKRCFTRYIDDEGEVSFPDNVGKCDHEHSCGYHYTPKDYFREHPDFLSKDKLPYPTRRNTQPKVVEKPMSYIANAIMERSLSHYGINPLYQYLSKVFGEQETERLMKMYHVGTSYKWGGSTIYWQVDKDDKVRTGKVMLYNSKDGHRVKEPRSYVGWAHAFLHLPDFNLCQCFFGEHLLAQHPTMSVAIVESVKIPVIGNGDIVDEETAYQMFRQTGVDGIMIGRGSFGNPWIFRNIRYFLETGEKLDAPTNEEKTIKGMYEFICNKARTVSQNNVAMVQDNIVYLWAMAYFNKTNEELGINKKVSTPKKETKKTEVKKEESQEEKKEEKKDNQVSLFEEVKK